MRGSIRARGAASTLFAQACTHQTRYLLYSLKGADSDLHVQYGTCRLMDSELPYLTERRKA